MPRPEGSVYRDASPDSFVASWLCVRIRNHTEPRRHKGCRFFLGLQQPEGLTLGSQGQRPWVWVSLLAARPEGAAQALYCPFRANVCSCMQPPRALPLAT